MGDRLAHLACYCANRSGAFLSIASESTQGGQVISFSQRTMRYFMLFVLNLLARAKVSTIYLELTLIYIEI